ncbi:MAG TPA: M28 family peptidase, partial [bacterium]|nr:M28 family peptidase [bacterium]
MNPEKLRLENHLKFLPRLRDPFLNPETLAEIESYIHHSFESYGYEVTRSPFEFQGQTFYNLLARKNLTSESPRFIIAAHFDAVPGTPGADDNASGTACLLEAARCLAETSAVSQLEFAAFNLEEYGLVGSSAYVRHLKQSNTTLKGMISLEMVGYTDHRKGSQQLPAVLKPFYPDTGDFIALIGDTGSKKLLQTCAQSFKTIAGLPVQSLTVPFKGRILPATRLSDHAPFWDKGYPALLITDTSFFRNPHYHTPEDTLSTLDMD